MKPRTCFVALELTATLHAQYVKPQEISESASETISKTVWQFTTECQPMGVLYAGVLLSRETTLTSARVAIRLQQSGPSHAPLLVGRA